MHFRRQVFVKSAAMAKVKVLQLHPDYNIRSTDIADLGEQIFKALPKERYTTITGFFQGEPAEDQPESCADKSVYFRMRDNQLSGLRIGALWTLYRYIKKEQVDVVICNRYKPINMMLTLSRFLDVRLCIGIVHAFGDYKRRYRRNQVKKRADGKWQFVSVSPAVKEYLLALDCGFEGKTTPITNAIDAVKAEEVILDKQAARIELALDTSAVVIGAIGRLVKLKGHANLVKAFSKINREYPKAQLIILGDGPEKESLQKLVASLGLQERVHLAGFVPDALRLIKAFDIFVMPSFREGLGLALLEAMCGKVPIIASNVPAMLPLIEGAGGIAVEPDNINSISKAISQYLELTDAERAKRGAKAYQYLLGSHSIEDFREHYLQLIEEGLKRNE